MKTNRIISPCINNCKLDETNDICQGCGRTSKEITHWIFYSDEKRQQIMSELSNRLENYFNGDKKKTSR